MKRGGFTLMELLVVTGILGVLIGVIAGSLSAGIRVWEATRTVQKGESEVLYAFFLMERDLLNTFAFSDIPFEGEENRLSFAGRVRTEAGVERLGRIRYALAGRNGALVRETRVYPDGPERSETLLQDARELVFRYSRLTAVNGARVWQDASVQGTGLPSRVEIVLRLQPSVDAREVSKTVLLRVEK